MSAIFGHDYEAFPFSAFSLSHWVMIVILVVVSFIIYYYRSFLEDHDKVIRICTFIVLFSLEGMYHLWLYKDGFWDISFTLPLQLCSISLILCLILLVGKSRIIFQIVYFIGITGATMAIMTPELFLGFPHFRYFQFFITHILIVLICLYFLFVHKYRPTGKGFIYSVLFLNFCAGIAFIVNKVVGGNYMFLANKPTNGSLLDYFGPYPYYILSLEVVALIICSLLLLPFSLKKR